ncbi:MAG: hypothetical protein QXS38_00580 [Candidatus Pacearchaeota archaeon]
MKRNKINRIEFNIQFAKLLKKMGYRMLAEEIKNKPISIYEAWKRCETKSTFFSRLGNGHCMRYYERRVLDDLFKKGRDTVISYANKKSDKIKREVQKRKGIEGRVEIFEPRMMGLVSPRENYRYLNDY